jgi:glutaredoxin-like protein
VIPLREQQVIRERFGEELQGPVKIDFFTRRPAPVFVPGREECAFCPQTGQLLEELARLDGRIDLRVYELGSDRAREDRYGVVHVPTTVVRGSLNRPVVFLGIPGAELFPVLLETIIAASGNAPELPPAARRRLKRLKQPVGVRLFVLPDAPYCAELAMVAAMIALGSPHVRLEIVEAAEFPALVEEQGIAVVPTTLIAGRAKLAGLVNPDDLVEEIVKAAEPRALTREAPSVLGARPETSTPLAPRAHERDEGGVTRPSGLIIPRR